MKATVDPDSAEGRAEIDRLQHQILQIYQSLRGRLRRENRASLKSQRAAWGELLWLLTGEPR